jgi:TRAP-type C4-dicarboxylate transport system permease small subunit
VRRRIDNVFDSLSLGRLSIPAKLLAGIVFLAGFAFVAGVIAVDAVRGTTTSTEPLIVPVVALPAGLLIAAIAAVDQRVANARERRQSDSDTAGFLPPERTKPRQQR